MNDSGMLDEDLNKSNDIFLRGNSNEWTRERTTSNPQPVI